MFMPFCHQRHDKSRFWELFIPTTNNFQFWLASSAFAFFAYQSLYKDVVGGVWEMIFRQFLAYLFMVIGSLFFICLFYLFIAWIFNIGIKIKERGKEANENTRILRAIARKIGVEESEYKIIKSKRKQKG